MTKPELNIVAHVGDTIRHTFEIRRFRQKGREDVSAATFEITWEDPSGANQTPLVLSSATPEANWGDGLVVAVFSPSDITAAEGVYTFALHMALSGVDETIETGTIEVKETPGV